VVAPAPRRARVRAPVRPRAAVARPERVVEPPPRVRSSPARVRPESAPRHVRPRVVPPAPSLEPLQIGHTPPADPWVSLAIALVVAAFVSPACLALMVPAERAAATVMGRWRSRREPRV